MSTLGSSSRWWRILVAAEIAVATILLTVTGALGHGLLDLTTAPLGFSPDRVISLGVLAGKRYPSQPQQVRFFRDVLDRYRALPGVEAATLGGVPSRIGAVRRFALSGRSERESDRTRVRIVGADYLQTLSIRLLQGRAIDLTDERSGRRVAVVNQSFAKEFMEDAELNGRHIRLAFPNAGEIDFEVIGIAGDVAVSRPGGVPGRIIGPEIYVPFSAVPMDLHTFLVVRTASADPRQMSRALQSELWSVDPHQPFGYIRPAKLELWLFQLAWPQFQTIMLGIFAAIALLLAAGGVYGVVAYMTSRETPEIGIRIALGASRWNVIGHVLTRGMWPAIVGVLIGLAGAAATGRVIRAYLWRVSPWNPAVYSAVAALLLLFAVLACYVPARRAAAIDPQLALRQDE